jgi:uncharacterized membrane protein
VQVKKSAVDPATQTHFPYQQALLFGLDLGGFFDGIVLHLILRWHHMLSSWYQQKFERIEERGVSFITFNYDRIIEHFFYVSLKNAVVRAMRRRQRFFRRCRSYICMDG